LKDVLFELEFDRNSSQNLLLSIPERSKQVLEATMGNRILNFLNLLFEVASGFMTTAFQPEGLLL